MEGKHDTRQISKAALLYFICKQFVCFSTEIYKIVIVAAQKSTPSKHEKVVRDRNDRFCHPISFYVVLLSLSGHLRVFTVIIFVWDPNY